MPYLLPFILCLLISFGTSNVSFPGQSCQHDHNEIQLDFQDLSSEETNDPYRILQDYEGIRILFDLSTAPNAPADFIDYAKTKIFPPIANLLQKSLKVQPLTSNIIIQKEQICNDLVQTPEKYKTEGVIADLVVFVTTTYDSKSVYIAAASSCILDTRNSRPIVGRLNYNLFDFASTTKDVRIEADIYTTMHELTHVLGFSYKLYPYYINPTTGASLTGHLGSKVVNEITIQYLNLPSLTARLRDYFDCPTLEGAYLENQGGSASVGSHFERRIFFNEYMTASAIKDSRFSEFTLAVLEGTGWYKVDYSYAEPMTYGKGRGCDFLDTPCMDKTTKTPNFPEFCNGLTSVGTYYTGRGVGPCGATSSFNTNKSLLTTFDYWGNKTIVADSFADNCPHTRVYSNIDCEDSTLKSLALPSGMEYYGYGAKGFVGTLTSEKSPLTQSYGYCFLPKCNLLKNGKDYSLQVKIGKEYVTCTSAGKINPPSDIGIVGKLFCPDPNTFCERILSEGNCKGSCFGRGTCVNNKCKCDDGWGFHDCIKNIYTDQCKRCAGKDPLKTSCYGDICECNPKNATCMCGLGLATGDTCEKLALAATTNSMEKKSNTKMIIYIGAGAGGGAVVLLIIVVIAMIKYKKGRKYVAGNGIPKKDPSSRQNPKPEEGEKSKDTVLVVGQAPPAPVENKKNNKVDKNKRKSLFSPKGKEKEKPPAVFI